MNWEIFCVWVVDFQFFKIDLNFVRSVYWFSKSRNLNDWIFSSNHSNITWACVLSNEYCNGLELGGNPEIEKEIFFSMDFGGENLIFQSFIISENVLVFLIFLHDIEWDRDDSLLCTCAHLLHSLSTWLRLNSFICFGEKWEKVKVSQKNKVSVWISVNMQIQTETLVFWKSISPIFDDRFSFRYGENMSWSRRIWKNRLSRFDLVVQNYIGI